MCLFRFEDLEIWRRAIAIGGELCVLADKLDEQKKWKFAEQLRGAALSISNNIAEGSGSASDRDFANFLKEDPQRIKYPSTKGLQQGNVSFDDRAVLIYRRKSPR